MKPYIGMIQFVNALPLSYGIECDATVYYDTPARVAERFHQGEGDAALIPVVEYLKYKESYYLVPSVSISSYGPTGSVFVVSSLPEENVRRIRMSPDSRTTNSVVQFLWAEWYGFMPQLVRPDEAADAQIIIGDKALSMEVAQASTRRDVGTLWYEHTGKPMVFAVCVCRYEKDKAYMEALFKQQKKQSFENLSAIVREKNVAQYEDYLRGLNYDLTPEHYESIELLDRVIHEESMV